VHRAEIATVLGTIGDPRAGETLLAMMGDPAPNVRALAAESLSAYYDAYDTAKRDAVVGAFLKFLDDPEEGPRASALKALVVSEPREGVRAALVAKGSRARPENAFEDFQVAERIVGWIQTGEGLDEVLSRLRAPEVYRRRYAWDLLRRGLRLPEDAFDPAADPSKAKPLDPAVLAAALERRRGAR
jgi:hypothetical protein